MHKQSTCCNSITSKHAWNTYSSLSIQLMIRTTYTTESIRLLTYYFNFPTSPEYQKLLISIRTGSTKTTKRKQNLCIRKLGKLHDESTRHWQLTSRKIEIIECVRSNTNAHSYSFFRRAKILHPHWEGTLTSRVLTSTSACEVETMEETRNESARSAQR